MKHDLETLAGTMRSAVEQEMRAVLGVSNEQPDPFLGMMHYHMGWIGADFLPVAVSGGKRIRPVLCLLCCMAAGGEWQQAIPAAAALEILHNFSLIHDDIQDASPNRRGRPTVWKIWGIEKAINVGDGMFAIAHLALNRLVERNVPPAVVTTALRRFDETSLRLTQGQHADMTFETQVDVSVEEYLEMITGKTAVLLSLCAELGALIAGDDPASVGHYATYGKDLGLAFQVKDDILGIWGDEKRTGKSAATDVITRKKTLPVLYGLSKSAKLRQLYAQTESDAQFVDEAVRELDACEARAYADARASDYSHSALAHLEAAGPAEPAKGALRQLADMLLNRDF